MRTVLTALCAFMIVFTAEASKAPYPREYKERFLNAENGERLLKIPYDFTAEPVAAAATVPLDAVIPSDYLITSVYTYVDTDVVSLHSNTVALGCETTNDLAAANNFADDSEHAVVSGAVAIETESGYVRTDGCTPTMTIGAGASGITAGRLIFNIKLHKIENNQAIGKIDLEP